MYRTLIMETLSCTPEQAAEVEDIMRNDIFHSTLDWQSREVLQEAARLAWQMLQGEL